MRTLSLFGCLALGLSLAGCGGDDDAPPDPGSTTTGIEIEGTWTSDFGEEVISDESWASGDFVTAIAEYSNTGNDAITQNPEDAGGTFNHVVWTTVSDDSFFYCTTDFGLATLEEAQDAEGPADTTDPTTGGCGVMGFPWTKLTKK